MSLQNVLFNIPELGITTRTTVNQATPYVPYQLMSSTTTVGMSNKTITDPSNTVSASMITANGVPIPITGTAANGTVLTVSGDHLAFLPSSGSPSASFIKYVSALASPGGDGSVSAPYQTIAAAISALSLVTTMKYIFVLPGTYAEIVSVYPNTAIIGSGLSCVQTLAVNYNGGVTNFTGSVFFKDITIGAVTFNTTGTTGNTIAHSFNNVTTTGAMSITSAAANTATLTLNNFTGAAVTFTGTSFTINNAIFSGTVTNTFSGGSSATNVIAGTAAFIGTAANPTLTLQKCEILSGSYTGTMALVRDPYSVSVGNQPFPGTVIPNDTTKQQGLPIQINDTNVLLGINTVTTNLTGRTNCTVIGLNASVATSSVNRTAIGYGATASADNQFAISDTATAMKASGLVGHASATAITYNSGTGAISFLTSNRAKKDNIEDLPVSLSGNIIDLASPKRYNWKESGNAAPGLIAEDVSDMVDALLGTCPSVGDLIAKDADGKPVAINYLMFIPHLINTVKELRKQVSSLKEQMDYEFGKEL